MIFKYYDLKIIPIILNRFKVNDIVICGASNNTLVSEVLNFCHENNKHYKIIDLKNCFEDADGIIKDSPLNVLPTLREYDAIFLDDDPNWYTVYNELNVIKKNNAEFPLVFICHNIFPYVRRDAYNDPDIVPKEYRCEFINEFSIKNGNKEMFIQDGLYHAIDENTPNNGVLTAIEDFLSENFQITMMDIKLGLGITILYSNNSINQIRLGKLSDEINDYLIDYDGVSNKLIENQLLFNQINDFKLTKHDVDNIDNIKKELNETKDTIGYYKNQIEIRNQELSYKDSQIKGFDSYLDLKKVQIKKYESKLSNAENEIAKLENNLQNMDSQLNMLQNKISEENSEFRNKENFFTNQQNYFQDKKAKLEKHIEFNEIELESKEKTLNLLKKQYLKKLSILDSKEYCIGCYKEEIENSNYEIVYFKNHSSLGKIFNLLSYILIILKSSPKDWKLNFKLYKLLKSSRCFDIGYYLRNNEDVANSKWCKYLSPELHYVCNGFEEGRKFNKKFYNRNSKKELLEYILKCS